MDLRGVAQDLIGPGDVDLGVGQLHHGGVTGAKHGQVDDGAAGGDDLNLGGCGRGRVGGV